MIADTLKQFNIQTRNSGVSTGAHWLSGKGELLASFSPVDGELIAEVQGASREEYDTVIATAHEAFKEWRLWPAPKRGEIVRQIGDALRTHKTALGKLVSWEMGKSLQEGYGEVQEMIDICDFAVGLSRQLYGLSMHSERPGHRMYEQWHPLGIAGIISAFNFPVAVWSWNAMIAAVCGDCVLWKPSSQTPLSAIAVQKICRRVFDRHELRGIFNLVIGRNDVIGEALLNDPRLPLISFTGSTQVGRHVAEI